MTYGIFLHSLHFCFYVLNIFSLCPLTPWHHFHLSQIKGRRCHITNATRKVRKVWPDDNYCIFLCCLLHLFFFTFFILFQLQLFMPLNDSMTPLSRRKGVGTSSTMSCHLMGRWCHFLSTLNVLAAAHLTTGVAVLGALELQWQWSGWWWLLLWHTFKKDLHAMALLVAAEGISLQMDFSAVV